MKSPVPRHRICVIVALLASSSLLAASALPEGPSTPRQLVERALARNAELKSYEAELAAARGERTQAGLWKNPEVEGEYGRRRVTEDSSTKEGHTRSLAITQTFEFPGKGSLRKAIADQNVEIAQAGLEQFRLSLAGKVHLLALRHQAAVTEAEASGEAAARGSALIELLGKRPNAGVEQLLELRLIEAAVMELKKQSLGAVRVREETRLELAALLGLPSSHLFTLQDPLDAPVRKVGTDKAVLAGLSHNFLLKIRTLELEKALQGVQSARWEALPDFRIGPFFSQDRAGGTEENIGLVFSTTLPLWNWNQGNVAAAQAGRDRADALLLQARRQVELEITRRCRAYDLDRQLAAELEAGTSGRLKDSADLADRHYRLGAIKVQLYLETQKEHLNILRLRHEAVLGAWENLLDLEWLAGGKLETLP